MNTNPEIDQFAIDEIKKSYERAVKNSPFFCDMLYWMGRDDKSSESIMKQRIDARKRAQSEFARHFSDRHCTSLNVLDLELKLMWEAMVFAHIEEKACQPSHDDKEEDRYMKDVRQMEAWAHVCDKAFDSIAVLLRIVDVIRNRQALGRPS